MLLRLGGLNFSHLQDSLIRNVREKVRNGEFSERGLARMVGISQPHMHNVLKGRKILTPELGDAILDVLGLCLLDVIDSRLLDDSMRERQLLGLTRLLPVLRGRLGPGEPFPAAGEISSWTLPLPGIDRVAQRPALVELAADPWLPAVFAGATHAVLDVSEAARSRLRESCWYALRWRGAGYVRQVRRRGGALLLLGQGLIPGMEHAGAESSDAPATVDLGGASLLQTVRSVVLWAGPDPRLGAAGDQFDWWIPPTSS